MIKPVEIAEHFILVKSTLTREGTSSTTAVSDARSFGNVQERVTTLEHAMSIHDHAEVFEGDGFFKH